VIHLSTKVSGKINLPKKQTTGYEVDCNMQETDLQTMLLLFKYLYNF